MKNIVLFLGAGASKAFGYPLTREILPNIITAINEETLFKNAGKVLAAEYRFMLKNLLISLSPGIAHYLEKRTIEDKSSLPLVTELLSQVDYSIISFRDIKDWNFEFGNQIIRKPESLRSRWQLDDLKALFEWAIISEIQPKKREITKGKEGIPHSLDGFIEWIKKTNRSGKAFATVITSNYDYSLEWSLLDWGEANDAYKIFDYGLSWRNPFDKGEVFLRPAKSRFKIFKLHGSSDWLQCQRCGYIYINTTEDLMKIPFSNKKEEYNTCHCGYWPLKPILVTPSFARSFYDSNLYEIWKASLEALRTANEWIIIGYSLPAEDLNIKSLFLGSS